LGDKRGGRLREKAFEVALIEVERPDEAPKEFRATEVTKTATDLPVSMF
jgi:hypothetical protein